MLSSSFFRLYLIPGVSLETEFAPRTRKEIKKVEWFRVEHLPVNKKDMNCKTHFGLPPNAFFMVIPFVKKLRQFIKNQRGRKSLDKSRDSTTPRNKDFHGERQKNKAHYNQEGYSHSGGKGKGQGRGSATSGTSPTPHKYGKGSREGPLTSPRPNTKHQNVQILKRDGSYSGSSKKSLTSVFNQEEKNTGKQQRFPKDNFFPHAWRNFTLDRDAIMACFVKK